ncbi:MAG: SPOR domain-containing protein [Bacteroidales bacterium]|jgi:cell division septation protein DedD|nr:SPOR domain-containing protein [Bacteroidales bacterium]
MKINEYLLQFLSAGKKEAAIPGLGVFYTDLRNTVSFREVTPSDRTFIEYVASKSGVDEIAVSSSIDQWVKLILQDLKTTGRSIIPQIGTFEVTSNKVVFTPEAPEIPTVNTVVPLEVGEDDNVPVEKPVDIFGMDEEENDPYSPQNTSQEDEEESSSFGGKNLWLMIAVSVVVLGVIAIFFIPYTRDKILSSTSGETEIVLGAENNAENSSSMTDEDATIAEEVIKGEKERIDRTTPTTTPTTTPATKQTTSATTTKPTTSSTKSGGVPVKKYNIIAGVFKERKNADKEVARFRQGGYSNAKIVHKDGFFYVSLNSFATKDEAVDYKLKLSSKKVQGWVKEL